MNTPDRKSDQERRPDLELGIRDSWPPARVAPENIQVMYQNLYLNYRVESLRLAIQAIGPVGLPVNIDESGEKILALARIMRGYLSERDNGHGNGHGNGHRNGNGNGNGYPQNR